MHVLILGGTTEASELASLLASRPDLRATLSLAGRTKNPVLPRISYRIGGFGGAEGLVAWMRENHVTAIIDATHPFASRMPFNAAVAAQACSIPIISLTRLAWKAQTGDDWLEVETHQLAIDSLSATGKRIFLTVGRLEVDNYIAAHQHFYLVRTIDDVSPKQLQNAKYITARAPFSVEGEQTLMEEHHIDTLITKNSGGSATAAKLVAARNLGIKVILISRPPKPDIPCVMSAEAALAWIIHKT